MHLHTLSVRFSSAALLLLAAAAAAPLAAAEPASAPSHEATAADRDAGSAHVAKPSPDEPKKICRSIETTSSRLKAQRVCLTREQWRNVSYN